MHALDLDFVKRRRPASPLGLLLLFAGAAAAGVVATDYLDARAALERVEAQRSRLERQSRQSRPGAPPKAGAAPARDDAQSAAGAVAQLRLPWDALLREIELLADSSVALLSVESQGQARTLRLAGEAKTMADAVAYLARLRESPWIDTAHISGHEERQAGGVRVIRFSLEAVWSGPP
jgi:Tfp pilus assembly protein PilN